ncbi:MAG TPA: aminoacyl-tRNA hydrolase [Anaerolineales bacterium]|nr:aminoacyl-tRNA hydrolase [Anaerolineales bacterium]
MNDLKHIVVGLGNPGRQYLGTRHNLGFEFIDRLCVRLDAKGLRLHSQALVTTATFEGSRVLLAKPQTYMNLSGRAVQGLANFYKVPLSTILVAHDDLDLPFGAMRLRPGGGPGGQKGVKSTIEMLGSQDFCRLRLGIGRPPGRMDPADYVLQQFARDERDALGQILDRACDAALAFVMDGIEAAMNRFNGGA